MELLLNSASLPGGSGQWALGLLLYTAILLGGNGQWNYFCAVLHCVGAVGSEYFFVHHLNALEP